MLYIAQTGCQWRYLPQSFGPWTRVWSQFRRWSRSGTWAQALTVLHAAAREVGGRTEETPSMVVIDTHLARHAWRVEVAHGRLGRSLRLAKSFETPPPRRPAGSRSPASPPRCATCPESGAAGAQRQSQPDRSRVRGMRHERASASAPRAGFRMLAEAWKNGSPQGWGVLVVLAELAPGGPLQPLSVRALSHASRTRRSRWPLVAGPLPAGP